jgi:Fur family transcriptional regulator, ferric uptake regulator
VTTQQADWADHTLRALERAGHRASAPRTAVVTALADLGCSSTARDIAHRVENGGRSVGLASVYRTLELLEEMRLVQRLDIGEGSARFEPAHPSGEHHHHIVCERCGNVAAFEDPALERAIERLASRVDYTVDGHDVTLRGECPDCRPARI